MAQGSHGPRAVWVAIVLAALALGAGMVLRRGGEAARPPPAPASLRLTEVLSGTPQGFERALAPRDLAFPADHGPHPAYRTEWWYFTGNLEDAGGQHYGFQLTFFRLGLSPEPVRRASAWASNAVYMAHFAVTDVARGRFHHFERFARAALGLAGARARPFRVWLEDWSVEAAPGGGSWRLRAQREGLDLDLELEPRKPNTLHGERGLSRKSDAPGNASYYYSQTRYAARGRLGVAGQGHAVRGTAWLDREWGTSSLGADLAGWDWLALQLDDGRDLMYYRLRRRDGGVGRYSAGSLVTADGHRRALGPGEVRLEPLEHWTSPETGARYPVAWRVRVPGEGLDLEVRPWLANQELRVGLRYWEGAVRVSGTARGNGYLELVGYARGEP